jgi:chromosome segregation ATPase
MEEQTSAPTPPPARLSLATLVGDIERRRDELKRQHDAARVKCLVLEDDLKEATAARDDAAARCNELSAQIAYLRGLAQPPAARQQPGA